jgi:hypothetical protein
MLFASQSSVCSTILATAHARAFVILVTNLQFSQYLPATPESAHSGALGIISLEWVVLRSVGVGGAAFRDRLSLKLSVFPYPFHATS